MESVCTEDEDLLFHYLERFAGSVFALYYCPVRLVACHFQSPAIVGLEPAANGFSNVMRASLKPSGYIGSGGQPTLRWLRGDISQIRSMGKSAPAGRHSSTKKLAFLQSCQIMKHRTCAERNWVGSTHGTKMYLKAFAVSSRSLVYGYVQVSPLQTQKLYGRVVDYFTRSSNIIRKQIKGTCRTSSWRSKISFSPQLLHRYGTVENSRSTCCNAK